MATSTIKNSSVRYTITSFGSGITGKLDVAIDRKTKSCIISGYLDVTNKTANALLPTSKDIDNCVASKLFPLPTNALGIWTHSGSFEMSNDGYAAWTGTGNINVIHCAFAMAP